MNPESAQWLSVSPASGTATTQVPGQLIVTATPGSLAAGTYTGTLTVTASDSVSSIPVTMTLTAAQNVIVLSHAALSFNTVAQAGSPLPQTISILNSGNSQLQWTATSKTLSGGPNWLSLSSTAGVVNRPFLDSSTLDVKIDPTGLAAGDYYGQIQVASPTAANSPQSISLILSVATAGINPGPEIRPTALVFTGFQGSSPSSQTVLVSDTVPQPLTFASSRLTLDGGQ